MGSRTQGFKLARNRMVDEQICPPMRGIKNPDVLEVMRQVQRHEFVPENVRHESYNDTALPIGCGQTISQPFIVALMTEQILCGQDHRVLEIGTGSGYQAAILSFLAKNVYSIEIVDELAAKASNCLKQLGIFNVHIKNGDGFAGWPEESPFDSIIVTCAPEDLPLALVNQLKEGGRVIIPVGSREHQQLYLIEKKHGQVRQKAVLPVRFVPMVSRRQ